MNRTTLFTPPDTDASVKNTYTYGSAGNPGSTTTFNNPCSPDVSNPDNDKYVPTGPGNPPHGSTIFNTPPCSVTNNRPSGNASTDDGPTKSPRTKSTRNDDGNPVGNPDTGPPEPDTTNIEHTTPNAASSSVPYGSSAAIATQPIGRGPVRVRAGRHASSVARSRAPAVGRCVKFPLIARGA